MPLYDFACRACGHRYEERAPADGPDPACPECGTPTPERLLSGFSTARSPAMKGAAAQRSNDRRADMVDKRHERSEKQREERKRDT